jgi:hypothetical protein
MKKQNNDIGITKIYLVENCYGDPNKVYIGKTKTNYRKYTHKIKFGNEMVFTYIDEINSLDRKDWEPLESYWIEQFRQWGFDILNKNKGGGGPVIHSKKTREKMSKAWESRIVSKETREKHSQSMTGRKLTAETKDKISKSLKGKFLTEEHKQKISNSLKGRKVSDKVLENSKKPKSQITKEKMRERAKPIMQYNLEGNFIKEWKSVKHAQEKLNLKTGIYCCLEGTNKTAYGYIWKYKEN